MAEQPKPRQRRKMHRSEYAATSCRHKPRGVQPRRLEVAHGALGIEHGKLEIVQQRPGVENGAHRVGIGPPGVERGAHGVVHELLEVGRRRLEPERGKLEVENQTLEVERELPGDGGGVQNPRAFRIGAGLQMPADQRRGCVLACRGLFDRRFTPMYLIKPPEDLSRASGPRCLFTRARRRSARRRFPGRGWPGWRS